MPSSAARSPPAFKFSQRQKESNRSTPAFKFSQRQKESNRSTPAFKFSQRQMENNRSTPAFKFSQCQKVSNTNRSTHAFKFSQRQKENNRSTHAFKFSQLQEESNRSTPAFKLSLQQEGRSPSSWTSIKRKVSDQHLPSSSASTRREAAGILGKWMMSLPVLRRPLLSAAAPAPCPCQQRRGSCLSRCTKTKLSPLHAPQILIKLKVARHKMTVHQNPLWA